MVVEIEQPGAEAFIVSEANGTLSRERGVLASGQNLTAGAVLGKITATGHYRAVQPGATDGSEVASSILCRTTDATASTVEVAMFVRLGELKSVLLMWPASITSGQKITAIAQLATAFVIVR